jgi:hypothetical protein
MVADNQYLPGEDGRRSLFSDDHGEKSGGLALAGILRH